MAGLSPGFWFPYARAVTSIRDARPSDAVRLAEIHAFSWQAAYRGLLSEAFLEGLTATTRLDWWKSRLAPGSAPLGHPGCGGARIVAGFVTTGHCDDDDRRIRERRESCTPCMWIRPVGSRLWTGSPVAAEDRFRADGYPRCQPVGPARQPSGATVLRSGGLVGRRCRTADGHRVEAVTAVRYVKESPSRQLSVISRPQSAVRSQRSAKKRRSRIRTRIAQTGKRETRNEKRETVKTASVVPSTPRARWLRRWLRPGRLRRSGEPAGGAWPVGCES